MAQRIHTPQFGSYDLSIGKLLGGIDCPNSSTGSNVENALRILHRSQVKLVIQRLCHNLMVKIKTVILDLQTPSDMVHGENENSMDILHPWASRFQPHIYRGHSNGGLAMSVAWSD